MARGESAGAADLAKHHARAQRALQLAVPVGGDRTSKFHRGKNKKSWKGYKSDTNFFHRVGQNVHFALGANGWGHDLENTQPREKSYVTQDTCDGYRRLALP